MAVTLEQRWNETLMELETLKTQIAEFQNQQSVLTSHQREEVLALAQNLPRLWQSEKTSAKDKKRILKLLIQDITVEKPERSVALLHIRWQGGLREDLRVALPRPSAERWRHSDELVQRVRELAQDYSDQEIADQFNAEGLKSNKGNSFTRSSVSWIRCKHKIPPVDKKKPEEQTVQQVAERFGVNPNVVYYWISRQILPARRLNQGSPYWIALDAQTEKELKQWVRESSRIPTR